MIPFMKFDMGPKTVNPDRASAKPAIVAKAAQKPHKYASFRGFLDLATAAKPAKAKVDGQIALAACASRVQDIKISNILKDKENVGGLADLAGLAEGRAEKQFFASPDCEGVDATTVKNWRRLIGGLPAPVDQIGMHLGAIALHFLSSSHAIKAVGLGWDELELFGLFDSDHPVAPLRRFDAMGLVPSLALSRLGARLVELEAERAIIKTRSGSRLVYPRRMTGRRTSIPLWKHPLLGGDKACRPG